MHKQVRHSVTRLEVTAMASISNGALEDSSGSLVAGFQSLVCKLLIRFHYPVLYAYRVAVPVAVEVAHRSFPLPDAMAWQCQAGMFYR